MHISQIFDDWIKYEPIVSIRRSGTFIEVTKKGGFRFTRSVIDIDKITGDVWPPNPPTANYELSTRDKPAPADSEVHFGRMYFNVERNDWQNGIRSSEHWHPTICADLIAKKANVSDLGKQVIGNDSYGVKYPGTLTGVFSDGHFEVTGDSFVVRVKECKVA